MARLEALGLLPSVCASCARRAWRGRRTFTTSTKLQFEGDSRLPRVANPSFWSSLIPKPLRRPQDPVEAAERAKLKAGRSKGRSPYTIFIILGILVGSNAIQIITLRNEMLNFTRKTDAKLELLREVVQKVKNGEDVDVKRALGTGDPRHEKEWEEVVKELEETDMLVEGRKKREARRAEKAEQRRLRDEQKAREGELSLERTDEPVRSSNERRPKFMI